MLPAAYCWTGAHSPVQMLLVRLLPFGALPAIDRRTAPCTAFGPSNLAGPIS